jgi:hypothetical protein
MHVLSHLEAKTPLGQSVFVPDSMQMRYEFTGPIVFSDDRSPIVETLQLLHLKVADVLDTFKPLLG